MVFTSIRVNIGGYLYKLFQEKGLKATTEDLRKLTALLAHEPRTFEQFANETAQTWREKPKVKK